MNTYLRIFLFVSLLLTITDCYSQDTAIENTTGYVIGDFNNWKLPEEDNLHGAVKMKYSSSVYNGNKDVNIPGLKGKGFIPENCKFVIYIPDGEYKGFYHDGTYSNTSYYTGKTCPVNFGIAEGNKFAPLFQDTFRDILKCEDLQKEIAFETRGWNGGVISFFFPFISYKLPYVFEETEGHNIMIYTENPWIIKELDGKNNLYCQYKQDGDKKIFQTFRQWEISGNYAPCEFTYFNDALYDVNELTILYSLNKDSFDEGSKQTIGSVYPDTIAVNLGDEFIIPLMRGGYPIKFKVDSGEVIEYKISLRQWLIKGWVRDRSESEKEK